MYLEWENVFVLRKRFPMLARMVPSGKGSTSKGIEEMKPRSKKGCVLIRHIQDANSLKEAWSSLVTLFETSINFWVMYRL